MLKWLTNAPRDTRLVRRRLGETQAEAQARCRGWLADKVIGKPQKTEKYTVEQLQQVGLVGVYAKEDTDDRS